MIPEHFYITGLGLVVYGVLYVPLSFALAMGVNVLLRRFWKSSRKRLATVLLFGLFIAGLPMLEVYSISMNAQYLCREQAGLKVYRVVEAEGFVGGRFDDVLKAHGYAYVEAVGTNGSKIRQVLIGGRVVSEPIAEYSARHLIRHGDTHRVIGIHFSRSSDQVIDRQTGEVLGELAVISIYPTLIDNVAIALTGSGSGFRPWVCGNEPPPGRTIRLWLYDLIFATIHPRASNAGEQQ